MVTGETPLRPPNSLPQRAPPRAPRRWSSAWKSRSSPPVRSCCAASAGISPGSRPPSSCAAPCSPRGSRRESHATSSASARCYATLPKAATNSGPLSGDWPTSWQDGTPTSAAVNVGAQVCTFVHRASTGEPGWTATGAAGGRPEQPGYRRVEATVSIPASWATRSHYRRAHRAEWPATLRVELGEFGFDVHGDDAEEVDVLAVCLSLIHISEPTRLGMISYAVFCLK